MKIVKIESGMYRTEDERYTIESDYTSANGGMKLVKAWIVSKYGQSVKTCKTLADAKEYIRIMYA